MNRVCRCRWSCISDYQKAPSVVQRFGDVKRLITQTLDPILTAYFRDVAQTSHMLDLLTKREEIQRRATEELGGRFKRYDISGCGLDWPA
jgi:uncharacterized membrane protein YqiK